MGMNISSHRIDKLDTRLYEFLENNLDLTVVEFGTGNGVFSERISKLTSHLYSFDINQVNKNNTNKISYIEANLLEYEKFVSGKIDLIYSQRTLHYLQYSQVRNLFDPKNSIFLNNIILFLSFSGINSELGDGYPITKIQERFHFLNPEAQKKHNIYSKICLYSMRDIEILFENKNFEIVELYESDFKNIKTIIRYRS